MVLIEQIQGFLAHAQQVHFKMLWEYRSLLLSGFLMTLFVSIFAVSFGTIIGLFNAIARVATSKHRWPRFLMRCFLRFPIGVYVAFFRGTPLFVQILLIHFAVMPLLINQTAGLIISGETAQMLRQNYGALISGLTALSLNAGAYITEIFRAGIQSISSRQMDAAYSLGMTYTQAMRYVIIPQAFRRMLPPLGNEVIALLKDSSLVSAIGLVELAYAARTVAGAYARYWEPYIFISLLYLCLTIGTAYAIHCLEKYFKQNGGIE